MSVKSFWVNSPKVGSNIQILNNKIHFVEHEGAECFILLHGLGFSMFSMRNIYESLALKGYRVIALDLPGCGYSTMDQRQKFSIEHMADVINEFLITKDIKQAHFVGAAEGATYAMCLAQLYPKKVKSLTLCSPGSLTSHYPFLYKQLITPMVGEIFMNFLTRKMVRSFLEWIYFNKTKITPAIERQTFEPYENKAVRNWLIYLLRDYNDSAVYSHLFLISCPVLIVWGSYDSAHPVAMSQKLAAGMRKSSLVIMKNIGHMVYELRAEQIVENIENKLLKKENPSVLPSSEKDF